ncbi:endonuclease/exonuclease/phosphatase family protein [Aulographum hederae CBS 113979]|uniref:Endonuclease/exonuclease/phosphatase family protein n=1 Tax=Aulographum hederae CBS 113979 TaxID=1176131 RepID=A0A6G1GPB3_9PEZI|nr:endonuclease/exonuclease/phosphatase family protein [Aulographum hederae CBS 113979]
MKFLSSLSVAAALFFSSISAVTISEINGNKFQSSYKNQVVSNVTGLVTAKGPNGIWMRSITPDNDASTSESIYVFSSGIVPNVTVGDSIMLGGRVSEYRSSSAYLYLTEITSPVNLTIVSKGNTVKPITIGDKNTVPPTEQYTSLDKGDIFGLPNNQSLISTTNPVLQRTKFGLDFWESLSGELVTVKKATAISKPSSFGDTWVIGSWKVTGKNSRGGLTMRPGDANPEAIIIGTPLDGTRNPDDTVLGAGLADITGVITYAFGFYRILPLTALKVTSSPSPALPPATKFVAAGGCKELTVGSYNVENLAPSSAHLPTIASDIVNYLKSPALVFLQEIQDDNGPTNDAIVDANVTLTTLASAISDAGGVSYEFADIDPVDDQDGGQPGGNIRVAYLYNPKIIRLSNPNPGTSTQANEVLPGPALKYNPGRIDPNNTAAWTASRKPLAAAWETLDGKNKFFTVNVHFTSKGGGSSLHGDPRTPVNGGVDQRITQADVTASFISQILAEDPNAGIITAGDFNEFAFVKPIEDFVSKSGLKDLDVIAKIKDVERYTYLFDMNCQQLDHMFVSNSITKKADYEHIHKNTWVPYDDAPSDHDPSIAKLNVCQ